MKQIEAIIQEKVKEHFKDLNLSSEVLHLLMLSVGRVIVNQSLSSKSDPVFGNPSTIEHIVDWLNAAVINNEAWLSNVDEFDRPKKLMKFSSIKQITKEADKAMIKFAQQQTHIQLIEGDEKLITALKDDHYIVQLLTPESLDRESSYMQHCIGQGGYDKKLIDPKYCFYSLRDRNNKPHATLEGKFYSFQEIENNKDFDHLDKSCIPPSGLWHIVQLQGKQNKAPIKKYLDLFLPFLYQNTFCINNLTSIRGCPYVMDNQLRWHDIHNLPENVPLSRLYYNNGHDSENEKIELKLPENIVNLKELSLSNVIIDEFKINTDNINKLHIAGSKINSFKPKLFSNKKMIISLLDMSENSYPEEILCKRLELKTDKPIHGLKRIQANEVSFVNFNLLKLKEPLAVKCVNFYFLLNNHENEGDIIQHDIRSSHFYANFLKGDQLPRRIKTDNLTIKFIGDLPKKFVIPEDTSVLISLEIKSFKNIEKIHIPKSIPDRVILTDGQDTSIHVGDYREWLVA